MRLRKLQCQLVKHAAHMKTTGEESENWESDLETYIKAVQDYDYMTSRCKLPRDPFYITERDMSTPMYPTLSSATRLRMSPKSQSRLVPGKALMNPLAAREVIRRKIPRAPSSGNGLPSPPSPDRF
ncbi:hypothetical protein ANO14919_133170 [Xylariales sp. No.14919]|nr:hypothetical protein ANO14919_133170 [Xylariales sp. No.14919]